MTTETSDDDREMLSIDPVLMRDVGAAADRAGMAPDDLIELALERWLAESERGEARPAAPPHGAKRSAPRIFLDWSH